MFAQSEKGGAIMEITISEPLESFVKQAVREGRYASEAEVVNAGLRLIEEHDRKLAELRAMIDESLKDTTPISAEEMDRDLEEQEAELIALGFPE
jgi:antitoxin ParD1/3/4